MKPIKKKKCRFCGDMFTPFSTTGVVCSFQCGLEVSRIALKKKNDKVLRQDIKERKERLKTLLDYIKITQVTFNKYINKRDKGLNCISCQKPITGRVNASHYYNANNHWSVRFDEDNVHSSCVNCNQHLHGNLVPYRGYLIEKIGKSRFANLESIANETRNFTIEEVKAINEKYKQKLKEL